MLTCMITDCHRWNVTWPQLLSQITEICIDLLYTTLMFFNLSQLTLCYLNGYHTVSEHFTVLVEVMLPHLTCYCLSGHYAILVDMKLPQ